jgi:phosphotransacetylase/acyl dehydratase
MNTMASHAPLHNRLFEDLSPGDRASLERSVTAADLQLLAIAAGDDGPPPPQRAGAGPASASLPGAALVTALLAALVNTRLPGPGSVLLGQTLAFAAAVSVGDRLQASVSVQTLHADDRRLTLQARVLNQREEAVAEGLLEVSAPRERIAWQPNRLPEVQLSESGAGLARLLAAVQPLGRIAMAVVHPCDAVSLCSALEARNAGLIEPVLVGPRARLDAVAAAEGLSLQGLQVVDVPHSHAAAAEAAALAGRGTVQALMKGSLHTDELMGAVLQADAGLRTKRRASHCFLMHTPAYPRPFIITDAALNIAPTLEHKADIVRNAIELARAIGVARPKVAILAAVETVSPQMPATLDAAALCKMADRGQISGADVDGPLAFDNAVSLAAARIKGIESPVAGQADVLVVPDLESGNMLAKQLEYLGGAASAGIVLGARVPIVLTSRANGPESRLASCALAVLLAHHYRTSPP